MILDASVAAKWFLRGEEYEQQSLKLKEDYEKGLVDLKTSPLILYELCNTISKRTDIPTQLAFQLAELAAKYLMSVAVVPKAENFGAVLRHSRAWRITVYDSAYATLSHELRKPLITADRALVTRLAGSPVATIFIGDY